MVSRSVRFRTNKPRQKYSPRIIRR